MLIKYIKLVFLASILYAQSPDYSIFVDIDMSPYAGGEDLLTATRSIEVGEQYCLRKTQLESSKDAKARSWRLSEMLTVWLPLNYEAMLIQHEVFGHGYRIRDLGKKRARVVSYALGLPPPYGDGGGSTSYLISERVTSREETAIASAGVEATAILANLTKFKWLVPRKVDARQSLLYLLSQHDITFYIGSLKTINHEEFSGHDIHDYLFWLNTTYPKDHLSSSRLRSLALISYLDPFTAYAIWAVFHFIGSGRDTKIPMIPIGKMGYLFGARLGLTPFGPELFWEHYLSTADGRMFYGYVKAGYHALSNYFGAGLFLPLFSNHLGLRIDLWHQPKLFIHKIPFGAALSTIFNYHWNETFGCEVELGAKSRGFLPGYSLWNTLILRGGLSARF